MPFVKGQKRPPRKPKVPIITSDEIVESVRENALILKQEEKPVVQTAQLSPGDRLLATIEKVADVYDMVANSISQEEIDKMNVKDKINALKNLSYIHQTSKAFKPNVNFIKINSKTGSTEDLEQALLDFNEEE